MPAIFNWQVTINRDYRYPAEAINSAEACSEAVRYWRKDPAIGEEERKKMVSDIHATRV